MKTINRNNYEEYFLLYADNELNAAEKLAVENFIQQNTDLAAELNALMHTKFSAEEIVFADKESLLRTEGNSMNETNHEEYFLLYIDNELSTAKRKEVEMYVLQHPKLQDEFTTLKQTVLIPEALSFGDKKNLYRTEKRRTVYLKFWRLAAAAVLIGISAVGLWLMQRPDNKPAVADNFTTQKQPEKNIAATKPADTMKQQIIQRQQIIAEQSSSKKENKIAAKTTVVKKNKENLTGNIISEKESNKQQNETVRHSVITHNTIAEQQKEPPAETHDIGVVPENLDERQNEITALQTPDANAQNQSNYQVYPVAYKEINTNDDDRSLHVGVLDLNKTKVKTLFKKAGRLFEKKSNELANEDGKLQVANFEIDTKKQ